MKIAIFGGTGKTGREVVLQALAAGHKVKVLARDPDKIPPAFGLEMVAGDVLDGGRVMAATMGAEAVVIALGPVKKGPLDVCSRGTELILQAALKAGTKKVVVISSLGVGDSKDDLPFPIGVIMGLFLKKVFLDKEKQEQLVRTSGLDWTVVRPTGLTDRPAAGSFFSGTGKMLRADFGGTKPRGMISRADVAAFVVESLTDPQRSQGTWFLTN